MPPKGNGMKATIGIGSVVAVSAVIGLFTQGFGLVDKGFVSEAEMKAYDRRLQTVEERSSRMDRNINWLVAREWAKSGGVGPPPPSVADTPSGGD